MLTLLIPNYNRPDKLRALLAGIFRAIARANAQPWVKVCVVDDYSTEDLGDIFAEYSQFDFFEFYVQPRKCGNAEVAALTALEFVRTDYAWLIGNDDEIAEDSILYVEPIIRNRSYCFILLNPCIKNTDGTLLLPISSTEEVLRYNNTGDLFADFGFVTSTTTFSCQIFRADVVRSFHRKFALSTHSTVYSHTFTFFSALKDQPAAFLSRPIVRFSQNSADDEYEKLQRQAPNNSGLYHQTTGLLNLIRRSSTIVGVNTTWFLEVSEDEIDKNSGIASSITLGGFIFKAVCQQVVLDIEKWGKIVSFTDRDIERFLELFHLIGDGAVETLEAVCMLSRSNNIPQDNKKFYIWNLVLPQLARISEAQKVRHREARRAKGLKLHTEGRFQSFLSFAN